MENNKGNKVIVKNISPISTEKEISTFFCYCGKIASLSFNRSWTGNPDNIPSECPYEAIIKFERPEAVDTALLLNAAFISGRAILVSRYEDMEELSLHEHPISDEPVVNTSVIVEEDSTNRQRTTSLDEKSSSRIIANLLANGYVLAEDAKLKAKEFDEKRGLSASIKSKASEIDEKYKVTEKANAVAHSITSKSKEIDSKYNISYNVLGAWNKFTTAVDSAAKKAMENETIAKGVFAVREKSAEIREKAIEKTSEIKGESSRKIDELHREREVKRDSSSNFSPVVPQNEEKKVSDIHVESSKESPKKESSSVADDSVPEPAAKEESALIDL